jgi:cytochrome c553
MSLIAQMLSSEDIKNVSDWYSKIEIEVISEIEPLNY